MKPLEGIRVIDFSSLLPGPFASRILVDLGASVIKVESPKGDMVSVSSPGLYNYLNEEKKIIEVDLKTESGRDRAIDLVKKADVLIEGFRPKVMAKLGFGYDDVRGMNSEIIYLSLSGYGQKGLKAHRPGHDLNYVAAAGAVSLCGKLGEAPAYAMGLPIADLTASLYGVIGVLAALLKRNRVSVSSFLDIGMMQCVGHLVNIRQAGFLEAHLTTLKAQRRVALARPGYGVFPCKDGALTIGALEDHFWNRLCRWLQLDEGLQARYETLPQRMEHTSELNVMISETTRKYGVEELCDMLIRADVPVERVLTVEEAFGAEEGMNTFFTKSGSGPFATLPGGS